MQYHIVTSGRDGKPLRFPSRKNLFFLHEFCPAIWLSDAKLLYPVPQKHHIHKKLLGKLLSGCHVIHLRIKKLRLESCNSVCN